MTHTSSTSATRVSDGVFKLSDIPSPPVFNFHKSVPHFLFWGKVGRHFLWSSVVLCDKRVSGDRLWSPMASSYTTYVTLTYQHHVHPISLIFFLSEDVPGCEPHHRLFTLLLHYIEIIAQTLRASVRFLKYQFLCFSNCSNSPVRAVAHLRLNVAQHGYMLEYLWSGPDN